MRIGKEFSSLKQRNKVLIVLGSLQNPHHLFFLNFIHRNKINHERPLEFVAIREKWSWRLAGEYFDFPTGTGYLINLIIHFFYYRIKLSTFFCWSRSIFRRKKHKKMISQSEACNDYPRTKSKPSIHIPHPMKPIKNAAN